MTESSASQLLYQQIFELAPSRDPAGAVALAESTVEDLTSRRASPEDAESCRLVALAYLCIPEPNPSMSSVWRTRALIRFAEIGWTEGVGAIAMSGAFSLLAQANNDYPNGTSLDQLVACPAAIQVLDELLPLTVGPGTGITLGPMSPSPELIARFVYEKRGALLLIAGDFEAASASYEQAAHVAEAGSRGPIKVALGVALVDYVRALESGTDRTAAIESTRGLANQATAAGQDDLVAIAHDNIAVMSRGGANVQLYEIL